jgi:hypothetical protein
MYNDSAYDQNIFLNAPFTLHRLHKIDFSKCNTITLENREKLFSALLLCERKNLREKK